MRSFLGDGVREVCDRGRCGGLWVFVDVSRYWVSSPEAGNRPANFDSGFDRPQPDQPKDRGADQDIQNGEEVWVSSGWLDDEFQEVKGDARSRDNLLET